MTILAWFFTLLSLKSADPRRIGSRGSVFTRLSFLGYVRSFRGLLFCKDSALNSAEKPPQQLTTWGTAGLLIQNMLIYFDASLYKMRGPMWMAQGTAVYRTLSLDIFAQETLAAILVVFSFTHDFPYARRFDV